MLNNSVSSPTSTDAPGQDEIIISDLLGKMRLLYDSVRNCIGNSVFLSNTEIRKNIVLLDNEMARFPISD